MVLQFVFVVTNVAQQLIDPPEDIFLQIKAEDGIFIGNATVTVANGLPFIAGTHQFALKKNDAIWAVSINPSTPVRCLITSLAK